MKKVWRVLDIQMNKQIKYSFMGVPETCMRKCFNSSTWSPAINMQQLPLGSSQLILGDSLKRVLQNLKTLCITTVMAFESATVAQLYRVVELMNTGRIVDVMSIIGINNVSRSSDSEEAQWEAMLMCLFTAVWQKFQCAVLTFITIPGQVQHKDTVNHG